MLPVLLILGGQLTGQAQAQGVDPEQLEVVADQALSDISPGAVIQQPGAIMTFQSDENEGRLIGRMTWADRTYRSIFELEASSALKKGASEVELLNLDGLAGGDTSITGKWTYSHSWRRKSKKGELTDLCKRIDKENKGKPDYKALKPADGKDQQCHTVGIENALAKIEDRKLRDAYFKEYIRAIPVGVWFLTFSAGASTREFEYLEAEDVSGTATFAELGDAIQQGSKQDTTLGVKWSMPVGNSFFGVGYEFRNKYKGGSDGEFCAPIEEGGTTTRCLSTTVGAPTKIDQNIGMVEWRTYLSGSVGLKLRAFWVDQDFRRKTKLEDEWEFHALLYFLRHKEKGLNGGIDIAYDTAFGDTSARLFIGQSFNLFN
jgi:hypothetical protein